MKRRAGTLTVLLIYYSSSQSQSAIAFLNLGRHLLPHSTCSLAALLRTRLTATSSNNLKQDDNSKGRKRRASTKKPPNEEYADDSVVKRLMKAATRAALAKEVADQQREQQLALNQTNNPPKKLPSLRQLTQLIDRQLQSGQVGMSGIVQRPRDSMGAVVSHNHQIQRQMQGQREIAILFAKPQRDDRITIEGAGRVRLLVKRLLTDDPNFAPDLICFVGATTGTNKVPDADASYLFFRYLSASQNYRSPLPAIHLIRKSMEKNVLHDIIKYVQENCLATWKEDIETLYVPVPGEVIRRKKKLSIHFSLFSSEYHLCQLNDIHVRSPNQSALRTLLALRTSSTEPSWSYHYTTTATAYADPVRAFAAKSYKTAQDLVPVLYNLRGVTKDREFFQRDNYRALVCARRSLVKDMEKMYQKQPSLRSIHQTINASEQPLDVALEGALLSLGRCLDLVRPAGLLTGPVSLEEYERALSFLRQAYYLLDRTCDPDLPLSPEQWGILDVQQPMESKMFADKTTIGSLPNVEWETVGADVEAEEVKMLLDEYGLSEE
jgi:hypothetical protein